MTAPSTQDARATGLVEGVVTTLRQYIDDMRYPPDSDSRPRRIAAAESAIAALTAFSAPPSVDAELLRSARWYVHGYLEAGEQRDARDLLTEIDAALAASTKDMNHDG